MRKFIGIDLHSNNSVVVVADEDDRVVYQKRLPNNLEAIAAALAPHRDAAVGVVIESPMPRPGIALSLAMTVRRRLPWRTSSSINRSGVPTPIKPPIIRLAPSGIRSTASLRARAFIVRFLRGCSTPWGRSA